MVDMAAAALDARPALVAAPWADLGTGSGALAVGLASMLSGRRKRRDGQRVQQQQRGGLQQQQSRMQQTGSQEEQQQQQQEREGSSKSLLDDEPGAPLVWAVDLSPMAVAYAAANAAACAPAGAVRVLQGSWWTPLAHLQGRLGGVLTNPPYIPRLVANITIESAKLEASGGDHRTRGRPCQMPFSSMPCKATIHPIL